MKQLGENGEPAEPYLVGVDSVWRSTDPLAGIHRIQVMQVTEDEYGPLDVAYAVIGPAGHPVPFQPIYQMPARHLIYGDAWLPDDTDLPAPLVTHNGKLHDPADLDRQLQDQIHDSDEAAAT